MDEDRHRPMPRTRVLLLVRGGSPADLSSHSRFCLNATAGAGRSLPPAHAETRPNAAALLLDAIRSGEV
jgi:hypothetical protein